MATYTPKQLKVLNLFKEYRATHGYSPTYAEMAKVLGVSTITVFEHLEALERKGAITRKRHEARSVELVDSSKSPSHVLDLMKGLSTIQRQNVIKHFCFLCCSLMPSEVSAVTVLCPKCGAKYSPKENSSESKPG